MSATDETPDRARPATNPMMGSTGCSEVLAEVWLFLDRECDPSRRAVLEQHLDECAPCLAEYGIDEKLKALLARKCGGDVAPSGLKERLRTQIRSAVLEQAEVHVESGPDGSTVSVRATRIERRG
ncbi:mycothiol system anti-sigma-R factor [Pseudonocardia endophytica]|uniref:Mycothiol system anti-sigma-R factor n=2 Tax=Pseudonocardia endophytica TaxID=401976 RepID=A0A4R1HFY2_PSEEN|nr:mycothiol system anti-sigma-R factor [Pseudonocardia endophytica]